MTNLVVFYFVCFILETGGSARKVDEEKTEFSKQLSQFYNVRNNQCLTLETDNRKCYESVLPQNKDPRSCHFTIMQNFHLNFISKKYCYS